MLTHVGGRPQAYYNPYLVAILRALVVSGGTNSVRTARGCFRSCGMEMITIPTHMVQQPYDALFKYLCRQGMLPLGLYRVPDARDSEENKLCYVVTNPPPDMVIHSGDLVYILTAPLQQDGYNFSMHESGTSPAPTPSGCSRPGACCTMDLTRPTQKDVFVKLGQHL